MIYDYIRNSSLYFSLGERIEKALKYLMENDFSTMPADKYEIDGQKIFALVNEYNTKPLSAAKWESHKKYIDIQYLVSGKEKMGYTDIRKVITLQEYDEDKDMAIHKGEGNFLNAEEGHFAIFFPSDIHMPSVAINIPKPVKKVVVKVLVDAVEEVKSAEVEIPLAETIAAGPIIESQPEELNTGTEEVKND